MSNFNQMSKRDLAHVSEFDFGVNEAGKEPVFDEVDDPTVGMGKDDKHTLLELNRMAIRSMNENKRRERSEQRSRLEKSYRESDHFIEKISKSNPAKGGKIVTEEDLQAVVPEKKKKLVRAPVRPSMVGKSALVELPSSRFQSVPSEAIVADPIAEPPPERPMGLQPLDVFSIRINKYFTPRLVDKLHKLKAFKGGPAKKTDLVICNQSFWMIMHGLVKGMPPAGLKAVQAKADIWIYNVNASLSKPETKVLSDFMTGISPAGFATSFGFMSVNVLPKFLDSVKIRWIADVFRPLIADIMQQGVTRSTADAFRSVYEKYRRGELKRVDYQGASISRPPVVIHGNFDDAMGSFSEFVSENESNLPSLTRLIALVVSIFDSKSCIGIGSSLYLYLSQSSFGDDVEEYLRSKTKAFIGVLTKFVEKVMTKYRVSYQADGDRFMTKVVDLCSNWYNTTKESAWNVKETFEARILETVKNLLSSVKVDDIMSSEIVSSLWTILTSFSVTGMLYVTGMFQYFPDAQQYAHLLTSSLLKSRDGAQVETFIARFLRFLRLLVNNLMEAIRSRDWRCLFQYKRSPSDWMRLAQVVVEDESIRLDLGRPGVAANFEKKRKEGIYPPEIISPLNADQRADLMRRLCAEGSVLAVAYSTDSHIATSLSQTVKLLQREIFTLENTRSNGSYRVTPFSIFIPGKPGIGKTTFVQQLHSAIGRMQNYPIDSSTMFRPDPDSNFGDGFNPSSWFLLFDDPDISVAPESAGHKNHAQMVMQYINSAPFNIEAANVNEKGKNWANFLMCAYATNFENGNLDKKIVYREAFWRRFPLRIVLEVLPQFRKEGCMQLDTEAASGQTDIWQITVSKYSPTMAQTGSVAPFATWFTTQSVGAAMRLIREEFDEHLEREYVKLQRCEAWLRTDFCPKCGMDSESCYDQQCIRSEVVYQSVEDFGWGAMSVIILLSFTSEAMRDFAARLVSTIANLLWWQIYVRYMCGWKYYLISRFFVLTVDGLRAREGGISQLSLGSLIKGSAFLGMAYLGLTKLYQMAVDKKVSSLIAYQGIEIVDPDEKPHQPSINNFVRVPVELTRPYSGLKTPTYTRAQLQEVLLERLVLIQCKNRTVYGLQLNKAYILTVFHVFVDEDRRNESYNSFLDGEIPPGTEIIMSRKHESYKMTANKHNSIKMPDLDLVLLYVPQIIPLADGWDILSKLPPVTQLASDLTADSGFMVTPRGLLESSRRLIARPAVQAWQGDFKTLPGDCGCPVIATFGNSFCIVGIHNALHHEMTRSGTIEFSSAVDINLTTVQQAMVQLETNIIFPVMDVVLDMAQMNPQYQAGEISFQDMPLKSSLWASMSATTPPTGVVLGMAPIRVGLGSLNTRAVPNCWFNDLPEFTAADVEPPVFKGEMIDGKWVDPFTVNLESSRNLQGDEGLWISAIHDYLNGASELEGWTKVRPLSIYEAVIGVLGTDIGGTNMKTSSGAPVFGAKSGVLSIDHATREVQLSPITLAHIKSIEDTIRGGCAYSPLATLTLKDEPVSAQKNIDHKIRVFCNMPFALNILLKKYYAPFQNFMRRHWRFFESAVGMNITGPDLTMLMQHMLRRGVPDSLLHGVADRKWFDTRGGTNELLAAHRFIYELTAFADYTPDDRLMVAGLAISTIYVMRLVKAEVIIMSYVFPTGYWVTLMLNSIRNSLQMRFAFIHLRPLTLVKPFRSVVTLITLGDDSWHTVPKWATFYGQRAIRDILATTGCELTSAIKNRELADFDLFQEVVFLKRQFVRREGVWYAPIDTKTIYKMLRYRLKSTLSVVDHHCELATNALAEAYLHGEEYYERIKDLVVELTTKHHIAGVKLIVKTFAQRDEEYKAGTLCTWDASRMESVILQSRMSIELTTAKLDSAQGMSATIGGTQGEIGLQTAPVVADFDSKPNTLQADFGAAGIDMGDPLQRDVLIATITCSTTDLPGVNMLSANFDPLLEWLNNAYITERVRGFQFGRFDMIVTAKSSLPGMTSGLFNLQAVADGGNSPFGGTPWAVPDDQFTSFQDEHGIINPQINNGVELHLPFLSPCEAYNTYGYVTNDRPYHLCFWNIVQLNNVLSATTLTGTVNIYVRLAPGYRFYNRIYQSSKTLKPNTGASKVISHSSAPSKGKPKASAVMGQAGGMLSMAAGLPIVGPYAAAASSGLAAMSSLAEAFGFTREAAPQTMTPTIPRLSSSMYTGNTMDTGEVLGCTVENGISIDPTISDAGNVDLMGFEDLFSRWTLLANNLITNSDEANTIVAHYPVTPMGYAQDPDDASRRFYMPCGAAGIPFACWRGDMEYCFYVVSHTAIQGSIQIYWAPEYIGAPAVDLTNLTSNVILDVNGSSRTVIRVNYASNYPSLGTVSTAAANGCVIDPWNFNGELVVRVIAPITGPAVINSIRVLVFGRACSNMRFMLPSSYCWSKDNNTYGHTDIQNGGVSYQSHELTDPLETTHLTFGDDQDYPYKAVCVGEEIASLRNYMQFFCSYAMWRPTVTGVDYPYFACPKMIALPVWGATTPLITPNNDGFKWTYAGFYSALFVGVRGSMRLKIFHSDDNLYCAFQDLLQPAQVRVLAWSDGTAASALLLDVQDSKVCEWTFPYYGFLKYRPTRSTYPYTASATNEYNVVLSLNNSTVTTRTVYAAYGSDISVSRFRKVPRMKFSVTNT